MSNQSKMFASLLKYWRGKRGLSQLDLALKADVSARHISFLETGRSRPSEDMVLRLTESLDLPLRERNKVLLEAGFEAGFPEPEISSLEHPGTKKVLESMMRQQEPYPLIVMDRWYNILLMNEAALIFAQACFHDRDVMPDLNSLNGILVLFKEELLKPNTLQWESAAREIIARLHRELLHRPNDDKLAELLEEVLSLPGVPKDWRELDPLRGERAVFPFAFRACGETLEFVTTITVFSTPQNVTLEELQIESYFPMDSDTELAWKKIRQKFA